MARLRIHPRIDIELAADDIKWINDGNTVHKQVDGQKYAITMKAMSPQERKIEKLERLLREARAEVKKGTGPVARATWNRKKPYTKRNMAYWAAKSADMKVNSPLIKSRAAQSGTYTT